MLGVWAWSYCVHVRRTSHLTKRVRKSRKVYRENAVVRVHQIARMDYHAHEASSIALVVSDGARTPFQQATVIPSVPSPKNADHRFVEHEADGAATSSVGVVCFRWDKPGHNRISVRSRFLRQLNRGRTQAGRHEPQDHDSRTEQ